jgi:hypothetical protein
MVSAALRYAGAETMGAMGVPEDFGRFIQAEKNGPPSCAALALEYRFRQQHVHALGAVDDLRHMQVSLRGEQHERVVARQALSLDDEVEHFADRDFRGLLRSSCRPIDM